MLNTLVDIAASEPVNPARGTGVLFGVIVVGVLFIWGVSSLFKGGK